MYNLDRNIIMWPHVRTSISRYQVIYTLKTLTSLIIYYQAPSYQTKTHILEKKCFKCQQNMMELLHNTVHFLNAEMFTLHILDITQKTHFIHSKNSQNSRFFSPVLPYMSQFF